MGERRLRHEVWLRGSCQSVNKEKFICSFPASMSTNAIMRCIKAGELGISAVYVRRIRSKLGPDHPGKGGRFFGDRFLPPVKDRPEWQPGAKHDDLTVIKLLTGKNDPWRKNVIFKCVCGNKITRNYGYVASVHKRGQRATCGHDRVRTKMFSVAGQGLRIMEICTLFKVRYQTLRRRMREGLSLEQAVMFRPKRAE